METDHPPIEAGASACVAGKLVALWLDNIDESVAVAVNEHFDDLHKVAAFFPLDPTLSAGSGIQARQTGFNSLSPAGLVRESHHQHFSSCGVLHDDDSETLDTVNSAFEVRFKDSHLFSFPEPRLVMLKSNLSRNKIKQITKKVELAVWYDVGTLLSRDELE